MDAGQGPVADRAKKLVAAGGVGLNLSFGSGGNLADLTEGKRRRNASVLIVERGGKLRHGGSGRVLHSAERERRFTAQFDFGTAQFGSQGRDRVFGVGTDVSQHEASPIGGFLVFQGFDQAWHGCRARFAHGVQNPHPHARIGIVH